MYMIVKLYRSRVNAYNEEKCEKNLTGDPMKNLTVMIKPASSLCNLRCKYCFYADISDLREVKSFGIMQDDVTQKMLDNIFCDLEEGDSITFAFQGGEPTTAGLDYFKNFSRLVSKKCKGVQVNYALQTNGTLIDEAWCEYLHDENYLVGVSLDLLPDLHDSTRVDSLGKGTWKQVVKALKLMDSYKVEYNVLCTLTNQVARHPSSVFKKLRELKIRYVQFTPCLDDMQAEKPTPFALTPKRFASFYTEIFDLWYKALEQGEYISIKLFDDLIGFLATGIPSTCDVKGNCSPQFVVEADGSVYPCDFYCLDEYKLGYITKETLEPLRNSAVMASFLNRPHKKPVLCDSCRYKNFCGGGCKRMQKQVCCDTEADFCGNKAFLDECMPRLLKLAEQERRYQRV